MIRDRYGLSDDDIVLSSPLTCMATNLPILANRLGIRWCDVDPSTGLIDLDDLERKLDSKTKIITFVHWGGYPVDLDKLSQILDRFQAREGFRPTVVEDCAHAFLSTYNGRPLGTHGNFAVFSLQAIKHLTTGDGGLLFCPDKEYYETGKLLRWYGIDRDRRNYNRTDLRLEHDVTSWGYKFHMNDINATIGLANLKHMKNNVSYSRSNAAYFDKHLPSWVRVLSPYNESKCSAYWLYTICVPNKVKFIEYMKDNGITVSQVHQRNDIHTVFSEFRTELPNLDQLEKEIVCIPVGWWLSTSDLFKIVDTIKEFKP
jgi:dTDP-4-amino-4,6-dideoxygalactose transaminase